MIDKNQFYIIQNEARNLPNLCVQYDRLEKKVFIQVPHIVNGEVNWPFSDAWNAIYFINGFRAALNSKEN